jgi:hypothetical protein
LVAEIATELDAAEALQTSSGRSARVRETTIFSQSAGSGHCQLPPGNHKHFHSLDCDLKTLRLSLPRDYA